MFFLSQIVHLLRIQRRTKVFLPYSSMSSIFQEQKHSSQICLLRQQKFRRKSLRQNEWFCGWMDWGDMRGIPDRLGLCCWEFWPLYQTPRPTATFESTIWGWCVKDTGNDETGRQQLHQPRGGSWGGRWANGSLPQKSACCSTVLSRK